METSESNISGLLTQRLKSKGIDSQIFGRFIKDLIYAFGNNPELSPFELDSYLNQMGWGDINLDYQTYQLVKACFENDSLKSLQV